MKNIILKYSILSAIITTKFAKVAFAADETVIKVKFVNPLKSGANNLYEFIKLIINEIVIPIGGVISVLYIIYAGFMFVTARGNEKKITDAKNALLYGAIGAGIILGAWAIANALQGTIDQITN